MKLFIILLSIFAFSDAQSITCQYYQSSFYGYTCSLTIFNILGSNSFTSINGTHLQGRSDADVNTVMIFDGETANIPSIFCSQFPNLQRFDLGIAFINTLSGDPFAQCSELNFVNLWQNYITEVPEDIFANNPK